MLVATEHGFGFHIDESDIPAWVCNKQHINATIFPDKAELVECWVASVNKINQDGKTYVCVDSKVFDNEPKKEDLLYLLGKHDAIDNSYISISKAYRMLDPMHVAKIGFKVD